MNELSFRTVDIKSPVAQQLIAELDAELRGEYAPEDMHTVQFKGFHEEGGCFVVADVDGKPVACGALRPYSSNQVELKRLFVVQAQRGKGIAVKLVEYLEHKARDLGFQEVILETGDEQRAAIALYEKCHYRKIEPFGEYVGGARSVCFGKSL